MSILKEKKSSKTILDEQEASRMSDMENRIALFVQAQINSVDFEHLVGHIHTYLDRSEKSWNLLAIESTLLSLITALLFISKIIDANAPVEPYIVTLIPPTLYQLYKLDKMGVFFGKSHLLRDSLIAEQTVLIQEMEKLGLEMHDLKSRTLLLMIDAAYRDNRTSRDLETLDQFSNGLLQISDDGELTLAKDQDKIATMNRHT